MRVRRVVWVTVASLLENARLDAFLRGFQSLGIQDASDFEVCTLSTCPRYRMPACTPRVPAASGMCQVTVCRLLCSGCDARGSCGARHEHSAAAAVLLARYARRQGASSRSTTRTAPSASRSVCPSAARPNIVRQAGEHVVLHGCTATVHDHDEIQGCASVPQATTDGGGARIRLRGWQFGWGGQGRCHS